MNIDWHTLRRSAFGDDSIGEILFRWTCQGIGVLLSIGWILGGAS
ncbi:hypothetical protein LCGC14_0410960 [marine sediment metagenome]|uniref:Uncharacterized protein n=1 Tax=marine sediment metagenome TaxID=412755 RepID=A0A0F9STU5_9ZZZZ